MDYPNHRRVGHHINISMQSSDNALWVQAYEAPRLPPIPESYGTDAVDVGSKIHYIEIEAYAAVLRAFIAQSDVLSWGKEELITELRGELHVTDQEYQKLLTEIHSDESLRMMREWQKGQSYTQELPARRLEAPGFVQSSVGSASHKVLRTSHADVSTFPRYVSHIHSTSAANLTPFPLQHGDGQRDGELPSYSCGNARMSMKTVIPNVIVPFSSKYQGTAKPRSKRSYCVADVENLQTNSDRIEIRATDEVLHKVESMIYGRENPDTVQVEKAKSILMEHKRALVEGLAKLADVLDGGMIPTNKFNIKIVPGNSRDSDLG